MRENYFDIAIIGGGPAGYVGAIRAAQLGARTALIERNELGGTCLNRGCIPSKALLHCVQTLQIVKGAPAFGIEAHVTGLDLERIKKHMERCVKQLVTGVEGLMKKNRITVFRGHGTLRTPTDLEVKTTEGKTLALQSQKTILATGSVPSLLSVPGSTMPGILTSDDALKLTQIPASIVIIGGGAIGLEWAFIYAGLGADVTIVEMLPTILPTEDEEITAELAKSLKKRGVKIKTGACCQAIETSGEGYRVLYETDGDVGYVEAAQVMMAAGRRAYIENLGLAEVGVQTDRGRILANERFETSVPGIYAAGDCLRGIGLAHQASHEAIAAVENALGRSGFFNPHAIPACVFTWPEIASVGLKEREARAEGLEITIGSFPFRANGKAIGAGEREGFVKLVAEASSGRLLGGSIIGPHASSLIAELTLAVHHELTLQDIVETIHAHPTLPEVVAEAAHVALGEPLHI
ncbi:MAG: dihydrolipoyl dehydrogenase [Candidatus Zipacnadales bacterium]